MSLDVRCILTEDTIHYPFEAEMTRLKLRLRSRNRLKEFQGKMIKFSEFPFRYLIFLKVWVPLEPGTEEGSAEVPLSLRYDLTADQEKALGGMDAKMEQFSEQNLFEVKDKLAPLTFQVFSFRVWQYEELRRFMMGYRAEKAGRLPIYSRHEVTKDPKTNQAHLVLRFRLMTGDLDSLSLKVAGADLL